MLVDLSEIKKGDVFQLVPIDDADAKTPGTFDRSVAIDDATQNKNGVWFVTVDKPEPAPIGPSIVEGEDGGLEP